VDLAAHRADGQTALHWAAIGGHPVWRDGVGPGSMVGRARRRP
jgi:hypothetical protein